MRFMLKIILFVAICFCFVNSIAFVEFIYKVYEGSSIVYVGFPFTFYEEIHLRGGRNHSFKIGYYVLDLLIWTGLIYLCYKVLGKKLSQ